MDERDDQARIGELVGSVASPHVVNTTADDALRSIIIVCARLLHRDSEKFFSPARSYCGSILAIFTYSAHLARSSRSCAAHSARVSGLAVSANSLTRRFWMSGEAMASLINAFSFSWIATSAPSGRTM